MGQVPCRFPAAVAEWVEEAAGGSPGVATWTPGRGGIGERKSWSEKVVTSALTEEKVKMDWRGTRT